MTSPSLDGATGESTSAKSRPPRHPVVTVMNRRALIWAVPVAFVAGSVGWALEGPGAGGAALIGGVLAIVAFRAGIWGIGMVLNHLPGVEIVGALAVFLIQLLVLVSAVVLVQDQAWLNSRAAALGLFATALSHQIGLVTGYLSARMLIVDTPLPNDSM